MRGKYEKYPRLRMEIALPGYNKTLKVRGKKNMKSFLSRIREFVLIQKEQVLLGLQFCDTIKDEDFGTPLNKSDHGVRDIMFARLQLLKRKRK